jgi:ADP-heptose:LPS heptosyltransferase
MSVGAHNPIARLRPYVVVHPGATVRARAWSPAKNRALVAAHIARGGNVVVTGGRDERELCAAVAGDDAHDLSGRTDFRTLARVIADADAIVVGNTGAAHVAAAVGTPVVSLFAPTIPAARFRPWRVPHVLLGNQDIACAGCRARRCPLPEQPCLGNVGTAEVMDALDALCGHTLSCAFLARALNSLAGDARRRREFARAGMLRARKRYSWTRIAKETLDIYRVVAVSNTANAGEDAS